MEIPKGWDQFNMGDVIATEVINGEWDDLQVSPDEIWRIRNAVNVGEDCAIEIALALHDARARELLSGIAV